MSEPIYLITVFLILGTILAVFGMKYFSFAHRARSQAASEDAYRELASKAAIAQAESATSLAALQATVAEINTRLAAVEKILKQVE